MPRHASAIPTEQFASVMAEALRAYAVDAEFAVLMARSASTIILKRKTWHVRVLLRVAEAHARAACEASELTSCQVTEPCGTGLCPHARGDLRELVGVPAVADGIVSRVRATRPQPPAPGGPAYTTESAVGPLLELLEARGGMPDLGRPCCPR